MTRRRLFLASCAILVAFCGCGESTDLSARYALERSLHEARILERAAYANYPNDDFAAWLGARAAYRAIVADPRSARDEPDMSRIGLDARIGLLRLYRLDYFFHAAVTSAHRTNTIGIAGCCSPWQEALPHVTALYDSVGADPVRARYIESMQSVVAQPELWTGTSAFRDSLMRMPAELAESTPLGPLLDSALALADTFYTRVIEMWPDSAVAARAYAERARVGVLAGRYDQALADADSALSRMEQGTGSAIRLLKGQILSFGLGRDADARTSFAAVVASAPQSVEAWTARLCVAVRDEADPSRRERAEELLRAIELDESAPPEVAASAMVTRATYLEAQGRWEDATSLLWRACRLYPYTVAALAAPLRVIRHDLGGGNSEDAKRSFDRASVYYQELIERDSARLTPRHLPKDYFVEACSMMGLLELASTTLESVGSAWGKDNATVARYKSALICNRILNDPENAARILQKSLALNPASRYLRATQRELDRIAPARGVDAERGSPEGSR